MLRTLYIYVRLYYYIRKYRKLLGDDIHENAKYTTDLSFRAIHYGGYKIEVIGLENIPKENGVLYIANHQSFFDVFLTGAILNRQLSFLAKAQFRRFFNVGEFVESQDGILIDRDDVKSQVKMIRDLTKLLKKGNNVSLYPEGTRSKDGKLGEFKSGSFRMALKSECLIVPITFYDNYDVVKNKGNKILKVKIDQPISHEEYDGLNTTELSSKVKAIIACNLEKGFDRSEATRLENIYD